jgi:LCP family protein required for cell wall assembly
MGHVSAERDLTAGVGQAPPSPRARRPVVRRLVLAGLLLALVTCSLLLLAVRHLDGNLNRIPGVFDDLSDRPAPSSAAAGALDILIVATDLESEAGDASAAKEDGREADRVDDLMLFHIDSQRRTAAVISIPADTLVETSSHGMNTVGSAYSRGGARLAVESVERLTQVRVDHLAVIDWARFGALVDAVGGITVTVPATVRDPASGATWKRGRHLLDGTEAVSYIRQRDGLPRGDLDRVARQHAVLREVMEDTLHQEMRKQPWMLYGFLDTVSLHLGVDEGWSTAEMIGLVLSMRNFRSAMISYVTMPVAEGDRSATGSGARVLPHEDSRALWHAVGEDRLGAWVAQNPQIVTP